MLNRDGAVTQSDSSDAFLFYRPGIDRHGLPHDPFNALIVPRPIGWITTCGADGQVNLAPYAFFNAVVRVPPVVAFAVNGQVADGKHKDTLRNIVERGEFVVNVAPCRLARAVVDSAVSLPADMSEAKWLDLPLLPSRCVAPPRIGGAPAHLECRLHAIHQLPGTPGSNHLIIGTVAGIHIEHAVISEGRVDIRRLDPLARLGYLDYGNLGEVFELAVPVPAAPTGT